jgi:Tfp pilus assembly protein PilN
MILLQLPGGVELLVILLIFLILVGVPAVLLLGALYVLRRRSRVEELENEVDALEAEIEELRSQQE